MKGKSSDKLTGIILKWSKRVILFAALAGGIFLCGNYLKTHDIFILQTLKISGNHVLSDEEIIEISRLNYGENLLRLDIPQIQHDLESLPWIKAVVVSRVFPGMLQVKVEERVPIVMIQTDRLYGLDEECVALPIIPGKMLFNVPFINGFVGDSTEIIPGLRVGDKQIQNSVGLVLFVYLSHPQLYQQLSEIKRSEDGSLTLHSVDGGTSIYLGNKDILRKIEVLARFEEEMRGKRRFKDYSYLDLRWRSQIVAKERI